MRAVERREGKLEAREALLEKRREGLAFKAATETSLHFHRYGLQAPVGAGEHLRLRRALRPCGLTKRDFSRMRLEEFLEMLHGDAQRHCGHALLWTDMARLANLHLGKFSAGELASLVRGFASAERQAPKGLLRRAAERLAVEAGQCSLRELADALHGYGLCGLRDVRLLSAFSGALPALLQEAELDPPDGLGLIVADLCQGLAALRWPDEQALLFASRFVARSLASPVPVTPQQRLPGPEGTWALNLFKMPDIDAHDDIDMPEMLQESSIADVCAAFATLEVQVGRMFTAIVDDILGAGARGSTGARSYMARHALGGSLQRSWQCPRTLGRVAASLARLGVTDSRLVARWVSALRTRARQSPGSPWSLVEIREAATTAQVLAAFHRDVGLMLGRQLTRALRSRRVASNSAETLPFGDCGVPTLVGDTSNVAQAGTEQAGSSIDVMPSALPLGFAPTLVNECELADALRGAIDLSCVAVVDLVALLRAARPLWMAKALNPRSLLPLLSLRCMPALPLETWPFEAAELFSRLDQHGACSLQSTELLEVYRCSGLLNLCAEAHAMTPFSVRCPRLARSLWQRMASALGEAANFPPDAASADDRAIDLLANFAAMGETLRQRRPGAVVGVEAGVVARASRVLRSKFSSPHGGEALPSTAAASALLQWCNAASPALEAAAAGRLRRRLAPRVALLTGPTLWRWLLPVIDSTEAEVHTIEARRVKVQTSARQLVEAKREAFIGRRGSAVGQMPGTLPLLRALLEALSSKVTRLRATQLLCLAARFARLARCRARPSEGPAARALRRLARRNAAALLAHAADIPPLLSQASDETLLALAAALPLRGFGSGGQVSEEPPAIFLPTTTPTLEDALGSPTCPPCARLQRGLPPAALPPLARPRPRRASALARTRLAAQLRLHLAFRGLAPPDSPSQLLVQAAQAVRGGGGEGGARRVARAEGRRYRTAAPQPAKL